MTLQEILDTNAGLALGLFITWGAAYWAYKKNLEDHGRLGDKVDEAKSEMLESVKELGKKIDAVRDAITHHETIWHAPLKAHKRPTRKKPARVKR